MYEPSLLRSLGQEAQLLFLTLRGAEADEVIRGILREDVDWDVLFRLARREKATHLLQQRVRSCGLTLPPALEVHLRRLTMVAEFKQVYLEQRLHAVLDVLGSAGIDVLLLKGAALAQREYPSFADRPMADLDLLLDASRAKEAAALLGRTGWGADPSRSTGDFYEGHHHLPPLNDDQGTGVEVELHTDLFSSGHPFLFTPARLWQEAQPVTVGTRVAYVPSPSHQIFHLCLHFAWSHAMRWGSWRTFRDLHAVLSTHQIDWDSFIGLARESRGATCCYWTFRLAHNLTGLEVPAEVLAALRPDRGEVVLRWLERHLVSGLFSLTACPSVRVDQLLWEGAVRPGRSGHGTVRPWSRSDAAHAAFAEDPPAKGLRKLAYHLEHLRAWRIYLRCIFQLPSPSGSPLGVRVSEMRPSRADLLI